MISNQKQGQSKLQVLIQIMDLLLQLLEFSLLSDAQQF